jgi:predicted enzyme related to lactoylglutathione lyase
MTDTNASRAGAPVSWFEIGTDDPDAARAFYGEVFGWAFEPQGPYTMITTGPDHPLHGGINDTRSAGPGTPRTYAVPYVQVEVVADACAAVEAAGGKVIAGPDSTPDGLQFAHVADPAGNHIGLWTPPAG